jgi:hypothetical protein
VFEGAYIIGATHVLDFAIIKGSGEVLGVDEIRGYRVVG